MMKRAFWALFTLCALLCAPFAARADENLVENPKLTQLDAAGAPVGWYTEAWTSENTRFAAVALDTGESALLVNSALENDARWVQQIAVEPNTVYRFSARVMAEGCDETSQGANISILNTFIYSQSVYDTHGEWTRVSFYGLTAKDQTSVYLAARVGGYGATGAGKAWFTDISVEKASLPAGVVALSLKTNEPYQPAAQADAAAAPAARITETILLMAFGFLLAGLALITSARRALSRARSDKPRFSALPLVSLCAMLLAALLLRLYVGASVRGYSIDVNDFMIWGENFASQGVSFYANSSFSDYPPVYMMVLGALSLVRRALGIAYDSTAHLLLIKLVPILCDLGFAFLAYALFAKKAGWKRALILSAAIAFNPAYLADSAAWGQVDSVLALLLAACVYFCAKGRWHVSLPLFALAVFTKPQALLFGPIGLAAALADAWRQREQNRQALARMGVGLALALATAYALSAPFAMYEAKSAGANAWQMLLSPAAWTVNLFTGTFGGYKCLSVNACNLYVLFNRNWMEMANAPGLTALSWALMAAAYAYAVCLCAFGKSRATVALSGAVVMALVFAFAPMMHERYLFPAIALLFLAYIEYRDWRLLALSLVFSLTQFLNMALVLQGGTVAEFAANGHLQASEQILNAAISLVNVLAALALCWTAFEILILRRARALRAAKALPKAPLERLAQRANWCLGLRGKDYALMAGVTCLYAVLAFVNLGATKAPQTFWTNTEYGESVVFDLGETREFRMTYYGGITSSTFTVALSNDNTRWTEENYAVYNAGEIFRWLWYAPKTYENGVFANANDQARLDTGEGGARVNYAAPSTPYPLQTARYVRITAMGMNLKLGEFGFWDVENRALLPVKSVSGSQPGGAYALLIDEQDTVAETPSYYNGTYFDEIYHARTAYEFTQQSEDILEWSHPHLGKILIMLGIKLFGMTPFGWRFAGALAGVLMLPAMYLLIQQLTKKSLLSFAGMCLLCLDSMHFTQTRIATVDSFAVFFIMLMYLFMFRYWQMNMNRDSFLKTLVPLGLSGLCMGLACASKWIGIYAAAGLAVLFFITVFQRFSEYLAARRAPKGALPAQEASRIVRAYPWKLALTLLFCVVAFVVVPLAIYYFSYYYHMQPLGGLSVEKVWNQQITMFNYHKGLSGDTHSFRSPWYEWPLITRPMWYYSADTSFVGLGVVSSISCMGNPAVWWTCGAAMVVLLFLLCCRAKPGANLLLVAVGFAAQFLPWVLVPRSTFIYHYFASVPFLILAFALLLESLSKIDKYAARTAGAIVLALALVLFIAFYPLESGYPCAYEYALKLRWFNWYNFALQ